MWFVSFKKPSWRGTISSCRALKRPSLLSQFYRCDQNFSRLSTYWQEKRSALTCRNFRPCANTCYKKFELNPNSRRISGQPSSIIYSAALTKISSEFFQSETRWTRRLREFRSAEWRFHQVQAVGGRRANPNLAWRKAPRGRRLQPSDVDNELAQEGRI